jgi:hypothetical protein
MAYVPFKQLFVKTSTLEPSQDSLPKTAFSASMPAFILHRSVVFDYDVRERFFYHHSLSEGDRLL